MKKENVLKSKSYDFARRIIKLYKYLVDKQKEFVLSKQVLRSGTSIGALIREGEYAQSKLDFISKLSISLKESSETEYWLSLLKDEGFIPQDNFESICDDCVEIIKLLTATIKTTKQNLTK